MQKSIVNFTSTPLGTNTPIVLADIIPEQEILVKRVILHVSPNSGSGYSQGEADYILAVTESDNGVADPNDWGSETRLVRSTSGNINSMNQIDTTLTMRKEGGSGVHAILRAGGMGPTSSWNGQLVIHYLEV